MNNNGVLNNAWFKLAIVSLIGIVLIFAIFWGIGEFNRYNGNMYMGYGYQMNGMQMGPQNGMMGYEYNNGMNGMNMQGGMNMNGMNGMNMQGGMNMNGMNTQGGMGMMGGMGMH